MSEDNGTPVVPLEETDVGEEPEEEEEVSTEPETDETEPKPVSRYLSVDERIFKSTIIIQNAGNNALIAAALAALGYDADKLAEGMALVAAAEELANLQEVNYSACTGAKEAYLALKTEMLSFYVANRSIAQVLFADNEGVYERLRLDEPLERTVGAQIVQVRRFFTNAVADPDIVAAFAAHNITLVMLEGGITKADNTEIAYGAFKDAEGIAQDTTQDRDFALDEMEDWVKDMLVFAKIALADDQQLMESLLVLIRTPSPASKDRQKKPPKVFDRPDIGVIDPNPGP